MTTRKPATVLAIPADEAFANRIVSDRDAAVVEETRLREELLTRESYYDREMTRLIAERDAEVNSLNLQIAQQGRIVVAADAALESLAPPKGQAEQEDIAPPVAMAAE